MSDLSDTPNNFTQYVSKEPLSELPLPLTHITDGYSFRDILENGELRPTTCEVFREKLLYLFYGRPVYRVWSDVKATSFPIFYPICILLKPECLKMAKRVFPFDSGAFDANMYGDYMEMYGRFDLDSFLVNPIPHIPNQIPLPGTPGHVVSTFFGTNYNYYNNEIRNALKFGLYFEAESYYEMIASKKEEKYDSRCSTIEIQTDATIHLSKDTVYAIFLPEQLSEDERIRKIVRGKWETEPLTYIKPGRVEPSRITDILVGEVRNFLSEKGFLRNMEQAI